MRPGLKGGHEQRHSWQYVHESGHHCKAPGQTRLAHQVVHMLDFYVSVQDAAAAQASTHAGLEESLSSSVTSAEQWKARADESEAAKAQLKPLLEVYLSKQPPGPAVLQAQGSGQEHCIMLSAGMQDVGPAFACC